MKELRKIGWLVDVVEKTGRFIKVKDLFGLFDLLCLKSISDFPSTFTRVLLVQVTCNKPHVHTPLAEFKKQFPELLIRQYVRMDGGNFKIWSYEADGKWRRIDRKRE
jgi:hypothetical protein